MEWDCLPMTKELRSVLLHWLEIRMALPAIVADTVFVCADETAFCEEHYGKAFTARAHAMKSWCKKVSIKPFGWHSIRPFTASMLFSQGYPTAHIQVILRHRGSTHVQPMGICRCPGSKSVKTALEEGLKREAEVIPIPVKKQFASG